MAEIAGLFDAVASLVRDGDAVALEGFTHLTELRVADALTTTEEPADEELAALRELIARG